MPGIISNMAGTRADRATMSARRVPGNPQMTLPGMGRPSPLPGPVGNIPRRRSGAQASSGPRRPMVGPHSAAAMNARARKPTPVAMGPTRGRPTPKRPMVGPHSAAAMNARARKPTPVSMGPTRGRAVGKAAASSKMSLDYIMGGANMAGKQITKGGASAGGGFMSRFSKMSRGSKFGIGLGLGIAAGVTMNRRGEGASSGRQSIYNY